MRKHSSWLNTVMASAAAFAVGTLACSFLYVLAVAVQGTMSLGQVLAATVGFYVFAIIYGFIPFLLVGVPLFGYLRARGRANYLSVATVGVLPGIAVTIFGPWKFGLLFLGFGLAVSLLAQLFAKRWDTYQKAAA